MTEHRLAAILTDIKIFDRTFKITPVVCHAPNDEEVTAGWHVQVCYFEPDIYKPDGDAVLQESRPWFISEAATESEVIDTMFAAVMRSYDHVVKEHFTYKGKRVFSPHFTIEERLAMAAHQEHEAQKNRCPNCGHDFEHRDSHYRAMHNATCVGKSNARKTV